MNKIQQATYRLAQACGGSPISSTVVVMLFFVMFNVMEATVEKLIFDDIEDLNQDQPDPPAPPDPEPSATQFPAECLTQTIRHQEPTCAN